MFPHILRAFYEKIEHACRGSGVIAGKSGRHMKFPYTFSAKIAQFPIFYYLKYNIIWMYYPPAIVISFYLISHIHEIVNSEENKRSWAETQRRNAEKEKHH